MSFLTLRDQSYVADRDARVARGGAFDGVPMGVRAADRSGYVPAYSNLDVGFRPARSLP